MLGDDLEDDLKDGSQRHNKKIYQTLTTINQMEKEENSDF